MKETILLFGFQDLPSILAVQKAVAPIEVKPVGRSEYGQTIAALAGLEAPKGSAYTGPALPGRMLVLCGLGDQVERLLPLLRAAGAGPECLKAVLTPSNRSWTALTLYTELYREHQAMTKR